MLADYTTRTTGKAMIACQMPPERVLYRSSPMIDILFVIGPDIRMVRGERVKLPGWLRGPPKAAGEASRERRKKAVENGLRDRPSWHA
jgi:hypothetical protein